MRRLRRISAGVFAVTCVLGTAAGVAAHEIGQTQVTATFSQNGRYQLDIAVDPDVLLTKLMVRTGEAPSSGLERTARDRRIEALGSSFVDAIQITFDDVRVQPQFAYL